LGLASTQQWRGFPRYQESYQTPHLLDEKEVLNSFLAFSVSILAKNHQVTSLGRQLLSSSYFL
jgi:hypothetical protein